MRTCINLEGKLQFERVALLKLVRHRKEQLMEAIPKYSPKLAENYCLMKCPKKQVCNFYDRYGMPKPKQERVFESVYVFEGGVEEI